MPSIFSKVKAVWSGKERRSLPHNSSVQDASTAAAFRAGRSPRPNDVFIALMGVTGSGKSSFIQLCSGKPVKISHDLNSCTSVVDVYEYDQTSERTIYLIDTPGFDDTNKTDTEVLREIAAWLVTSYRSKVLLNGIIYLHRISDGRMRGSARRNLLMFRQLCGPDALKRVILATTMWDKTEIEKAKSREQQLIDDDNFWGLMIAKGSSVRRHYNTTESAHNIVHELAGDGKQVTLSLQDEMVNKKKGLDQTSAGQELDRELAVEKARAVAERKALNQEWEKAMQTRNQQAAEEIKDLQDDYARQIEKLERDQRKLHISQEKLHKDRMRQLEKLIKDRDAEYAAEMRKRDEERVALEREKITLAKEKKEKEKERRLQEERHRHQLEEEREKARIERQRREEEQVKLREERRQAARDRERREEEERCQAARDRERKEEERQQAAREMQRREEEAYAIKVERQQAYWREMNNQNQQYYNSGMYGNTYGTAVAAAWGSPYNFSFSSVSPAYTQGSSSSSVAYAYSSGGGGSRSYARAA